MNLLIKDFPDELVRELKSEAALHGVTLKELVVGKCTAKKSSNFGLGESAGAPKESPVMSPPEEIQKGVESASTSLGGRGKRPREGSRKGMRMPAEKSVLRGSGGETEPATPANPGAVPTSFANRHDAKACRIYRCGTCAAMGHKDSHRGLS